MLPNEDTSLKLTVMSRHIQMLLQELNEQFRNPRDIVERLVELEYRHFYRVVQIHV